MMRMIISKFVGFKLKILNILFILLIIFLLLIGCQAKNTNMSEKIIKTIDNKCDQGDTFMISMKDITDFEWDKMVIFEVGSSNFEVSKALGIEYKESTDLMSGMVFVCNNKIVHEERVPYNPDRPEKLRYIVEHKPKEPNCTSFTPNDAVLKGSREKIDGVFYYKIIAVREEGEAR